MSDELTAHLRRVDQHYAGGDEPDRRRLRSLADVLAGTGPGDTTPPAVAARVAYRGRVVMLSCREKRGKSTLARMLVAYASGHAEVKEAIGGVLKQLDVPVAALFSTLGRTAARGVETLLIARWAKEFYNQLLANIAKGETRTADTSRWEPATWPAEARGVGLSEAPRGALSHWIVIRDGKIDNYQLVVPSTWNASPRDGKGQMSAYESSLIGTPVARTEQPLEILRTIHSFDPCIACAVHVHDPHGRHVHHLDTF